MDRRSLLTAAAITPVAGLILPEAAKAAPAGFNSTFNGSKAGWSNVRGNWVLKPGTLYSKGIAGTRSSAKRTGNFSNFYYKVRMLRRGNSSGIAANTLHLRGNPTTVDGDGHWLPGYLFQYANAGWYSVFRINADGGVVAVATWTTTTSVFRTGYNLVEVWVDGTYLDFHINGVHQFSTFDGGALTFGQVGVGFYTEPGRNAECFVDSAYLTTGMRHAPCRLTTMGTAVRGGSVDLAPR